LETVGFGQGRRTGPLAEKIEKGSPIRLTPKGPVEIISFIRGGGKGQDGERKEDGRRTTFPGNGKRWENVGKKRKG